MAKWNKKCDEFVEVRKLIENEDSKGILTKLVDICKKYGNEDWDFAEDFVNLADDIFDEISDDADSDTTDYYLNEFYDLCDNARVWLAI